MIKNLKMYKLQLSLLFMFSFCHIILIGQNQSSCKDGAQGAPSDDYAKISSMIETYFEGWMTGDTTKLGRAMHRTCQLKNIKDDDVIIYDRATYLSFFKPRPRRENAGGKIISIDITGDSGAAKCEIHTADNLFTDYFNLFKIKDEWYIVDKVATSRPRTD